MNFLKNELPTLLEDVPLNIRMGMYFQPDGAPAHFAHQVRQYLDKRFPGVWIGRGGSINWLPRSSDLIPLDYCLWGWLNNGVYKVKFNSRDALIHCIINTAADIKERHEAIRRVTGALLERSIKSLEMMVLAN